MKKKKHRARKLRKCELGIKTKSFNHGFRHRMGLDGKFYPISNQKRMKMEIECPKCDTLIEFDSGELPERACDDAEVSCEKCEYEFLVGWYATAEIR